MTLALLGALGAAACYGLATVFQAVGVRRAGASGATGSDLIGRLGRQGPFVLGTMLDVVGAALAFAALRELPLFVVQAAVASSLAVTAVVAARVFHTRLMGLEWAGVGAVAVGLTMLAVASGEQPVQPGSLTIRVALLVAVVAVAALALPASRLRGPSAALALGALAGAEYGLASTGVRVIDQLTFPAVLWNPAAIAAVVGAVVGVCLIATALHRGAVTTASGAMTVAETLLPAVLGLVLLGERPRPGWEAVAVVGFVVAVGGALALSRFGEPPVTAGDELPDEAIAGSAISR